MSETRRGVLVCLGENEHKNIGDDDIVRSPVAPQSADGKFHLSDRPPVKTAHLKYAESLAARCSAFFSGQKCYAALASVQPKN